MYGEYCMDCICVCLCYSLFAKISFDRIVDDDLLRPMFLTDLVLYIAGATKAFAQNHFCTKFTKMVFQRFRYFDKRQYQPKYKV